MVIMHVRSEVGRVGKEAVRQGGRGRWMGRLVD